MAHSAFVELGVAVDLFENGAGTSERAKIALVSYSYVLFTSKLLTLAYV